MPLAFPATRLPTQLYGEAVSRLTTALSKAWSRILAEQISLGHRRRISRFVVRKLFYLFLDFHREFDRFFCVKTVRWNASVELNRRIGCVIFFT